MPGQLAGRVALVTGAASGIGRAIALRFAREGAKVAIVDINPNGAREVAKEIKGLKGKAIAIRCDVAIERQVKRIVAVGEMGLEQTCLVCCRQKRG
jgi:3-oxoacyl-[acyl-carrier protein] reductase